MQLEPFLLYLLARMIFLSLPSSCSLSKQTLHHITSFSFPATVTGKVIHAQLVVNVVVVVVFVGSGSSLSPCLGIQNEI